MTFKVVGRWNLRSTALVEAWKQDASLINFSSSLPSVVTKLVALYHFGHCILLLLYIEWRNSPLLLFWCITPQDPFTSFSYPFSANPFHCLIQKKTFHDALWPPKSIHVSFHMLVLAPAVKQFLIPLFWPNPTKFKLFTYIPRFDGNLELSNLSISTPHLLYCAHAVVAFLVVCNLSIKISSLIHYPDTSYTEQQ